MAYYYLSNEKSSGVLESSFKYNEETGEIQGGINSKTPENLFEDFQKSPMMLASYLHEISPLREDPDYREGSRFNTIQFNKAKIETSIKLSTKEGYEKLIKLGFPASMIFVAFLSDPNLKATFSPEEYIEMMHYLSSVYTSRDSERSSSSYFERTSEDELRDGIVMEYALILKDTIVVSNLIKNGIKRAEFMEFNFLNDEYVDIIKCLAANPPSKDYLETLLTIVIRTNQKECLIAIINAWPYNFMPIKKLSFPEPLKEVLDSLQKHWLNYANYMKGAKPIRDNEPIPEGYFVMKNPYNFNFVKKYDQRKE